MNSGSRVAVLLLCAQIAAFSSSLTTHAQPAVDWDTLGANASTIINTGQTFTDIGTTLGRVDLVGVDLTVTYSGTGLGGNKLRINDGSVDDDQWNLYNGTLSFSFTSPVTIRYEGGGSLLAGEIDTFGPASIGSLISTHTESGLVVTDDSVANPTANHIVTSGLVWLSLPDTGFFHDVQEHNQGARLFIIPEPHSLPLAALGLSFLARRRGHVFRKR